MVEWIMLATIIVQSFVVLWLLINVYRQRVQIDMLITTTEMLTNLYEAHVHRCKRAVDEITT